MRTGWTPDVLADLPFGFRAACHWALYVHAIVGDQGIPDVSVPAFASREAKLQAQAARVELLRIRSAVYPDG